MRLAVTLFVFAAAVLGISAYFARIYLPDQKHGAYIVRLFRNMPHTHVRIRGICDLRYRHTVHNDSIRLDSVCVATHPPTPYAHQMQDVLGPTSHRSRVSVRSGGALAKYVLAALLSVPSNLLAQPKPHGQRAFYIVCLVARAQISQ